MTTPARTQSITQGLATAGVTVSWPFIRQVGATTIVLEPIAQVALSPDYKVNPDIPNEDDVVFQYDETNLFSPEKFNGFDLYDGGQRLNVGGQASSSVGRWAERYNLLDRPHLPRRADQRLSGSRPAWIRPPPTG